MLNVYKYYLERAGLILLGFAMALISRLEQQPVFFKLVAFYATSESV